MSENLSNAAFGLQIFKEYARNELISVLNGVSGQKGLVLDPSLSGPLGLVADIQLLLNNGVAKIHYLLMGTCPTNCTSLIYLVRPTVENMKIIAHQIHDHQSKNQKINYHVVFVPRRTLPCERVLEEEKVYGSINFGEYKLDLIPFEDDLLSLELPNSFRECFLEGDKTSLFYVATAIMKIQSVFGLIGNIKGKGKMARSVADMLLRMRKEMGTEDTEIAPEIDTLILIDRTVDLITPMCTQLTYEGLIDEVIGVTDQTIELDGKIIEQLTNNNNNNNQAQSLAKKKYKLSGECALFSEVRDIHFSQLGPSLNAKAKEIDQYYKKSNEQNTLGEIRDYMKGLTSYKQAEQSLVIHTNIGEKLVNHTNEDDFTRTVHAQQGLLFLEDALEYIDELICKLAPIQKILRLLVLQSLTHNGIRQKYLDPIKTSILQNYGYEYIYTLNNLESLGMLKNQTTKPYFTTLRKQLKLFEDTVDIEKPTDFAYTYSGYAPISCRFVQNTNTAQGWKSMEEILKYLPGPTFEERQQIPEGAIQLSEDRIQTEGAKSKVTLVFFIGGITYSEISALRFLHKQENQKRDFIIATTKLINGTTLIESIMDKIGNVRDLLNKTTSINSNNNNDNPTRR
eukprot:TRINITY_DN1447_c1_g1_i1.p1 TRINITY_DN1447_c1_g1~~TRINITY_DN1447_c1_g1_i1.p1  ORF type:complete len:624 (+),score=182.50 TRINITY_DN1447_c1_g1_i1:123-1994(+)